MKRILLLLILVFPLLCRADDIHSYHFYVAPIQLQPSPWDDTASLQASCNAGNFTLTRNYSISSQVIVTYQLHLAGFSISTSQTTGAALRIGSSGGKIEGGTIQGPWNYLTDAINPSGGTGIIIQASNCFVQNVTIQNFSGYGINCFPESNITITHNKILKVGYIGFYFDAETNGTTGNVFSNNTVDKSMLNPATVIQLAVGIRGSTSIATDTTFNWTIAADTLKMPLITTAETECIEVRYIKGSTISNLVCTGGSIGISAIQATHMVYSNNKISGNSEYGFEIGNNQFSITSGNIIVETSAIGMILDGGATPCYSDSLNNDHITTTGHIALQLFTNTHNIVISGATIVHTTQGIYCTNADSISVINTSINGGSHVSTTGIYVNGGHGNISISRGSIINNTYAVYSNNSAINQVVDYIIGVSVNLTGTPTQFGRSFSNGAHYGVNVYFTSGSMVFGPISSKVYGDPDFSPGAISALTITYVSSNTAVATIVVGNIHIIKVGTVNITASNSDTSAVQSVTITKAMLTITADNKRKAYRAVNPALTVSFSGWKYGQTNSVLITQPTSSTTALTLSPPANYPIAVSGAVSDNYNFTYRSGLLTIDPSGSGHGIALRMRGKIK